MPGLCPQLAVSVASWCQHGRHPRLAGPTWTEEPVQVPCRRPPVADQRVGDTRRQPPSPPTGEATSPPTGEPPSSSTGEPPSSARASLPAHGPRQSPPAESVTLPVSYQRRLSCHPLRYRIS